MNRTSLLLLLFFSTASAFGNYDRLFKNKMDSRSNVYFETGGDSPYLYKQGEINTPASLTKIFTSHLAIEHFGLDYEFSLQVRWKTDPHHTEQISNLEFSGEGLPDFDALAFIKQLKAKGVRKISGPVFFNFQNDFLKPLDMDEVSDSGYCYNAVPGALNFKQNCVSMTVTSRGVRVSDPDLKAPIKLDIKLGTKYNGTRPHFRWTNNEKSDFEYVIVARLKDSSQSAKVDVVVPSTEDWIQRKLVRLAQDNGIQWDVEDSSTLSQPQSFTLYSSPLEDYLCPTLQESINVYAQFFFDSTPLQIQSSYLQNYNIRLADGSGMSRANQVPGHSILQVLEEIQKDKTEFSFYQDCLPQPGGIGTLEKRLGAYKNLIIAKTGSLSGISNIAGFFKRSNEDAWIPFVFLYENKEKRLGDLRRVQDGILGKIVNP